MRRAAKVDGNHGTIVDALRKVGASVTSLASVGGGCPDIVIGYRGRTFLVEIKDPTQPAGKRALTPDQKDWHVAWRGQVAICETIDDAMAVIGLLTRSTADSGCSTATTSMSHESEGGT